MVHAVSSRRSTRIPILTLHRPQYTLFELPKDEIKHCIDLAGRAIVIASWLAAVARRELSRFKEFISFIRHGRSRLIDPLLDVHVKQ